MELKNAVALVEKGIDQDASRQVWLDLGAGSGLFTSVLTTLLPGGSTVYAIDKEQDRLKWIGGVHYDVQVTLVQQDFVKDPVAVDHCDGIMMANSLHYVADQPAFLRKMKNTLRSGGRMMIVEYDTKQANRWVPYPVSYDALEQLVQKAELGTLTKLATQPSVYHTEGLYSALIQL